MNIGHRTIVLTVLASLASPALGQQSVVDSSHNLSASGRGSARATAEEQVCIFCHTPHRATAAQPLWNRRAPAGPFTIYDSSSLDAQPGQPTGTSKKCLSCHDGSIALGNVLSRDQIIIMSGIGSTISGAANLGTDLSDDHPISFPYDHRLSSQDTRLVSPGALPVEIHLDVQSELQCTACHDPHDNTFGHFLVMDNSESTLCTSCHQIADTTIDAHADCAVCHTMHSAPSGPFLLTEPSITEMCTSCHDGTVARAANILADLGKLSVHDTNRPTDPNDRSPHSSCTDCHEPHTMNVGAPARAPNIPANFGLIETGTRNRGNTGIATFEYEVCFGCHGDENLSEVTPWVSRQIAQASLRLQFDPRGPSYHPVVAAGRNPDVPSLRPGWNEGSLVLCSDCHGSDTSRKAGGSGPNGVHGSNFAPLLLARYDTIDYTPESRVAYALCYRCHEREGRGGILRDVSFPHRAHVVDAQTPCSVCHDAHGISSAQGNRRNNSHLINFDTSVVFPDPVRGRIEFVDTGTYSGSCTLTCHGVAHTRRSY